MANVNLLIIGTSRGGWKKGKKGDLWSIAVGDFGNAEVAPDWVQLIITDVPNGFSDILQYFNSFSTAFQVYEVSGAAPQEQRYRVEVLPELTSIPNPIFLKIRDNIVNKFSLSGSYESQSPGSWFEFDSHLDTPIDEIHYEIGNAAEDIRRYKIDENYVDNLLGSVSTGQPAQDSQSYSWFQANLIDKLLIE